MIKSSVIKANAVYIDTKAAKEEQIAAYKTRDALLEEALREFRCFDSNFRTLMELSNFKARELHRIKLALLSIIEKEKEAIRQADKLENKTLPQDIDYLKIDGLRIEARQKLNKIRPKNLGQAGRILGVSPADIQILIVYLAQNIHNE